MLEKRFGGFAHFIFDGDPPILRAIISYLMREGAETAFVWPRDPRHFAVAIPFLRADLIGDQFVIGIVDRDGDSHAQLAGLFHILKLLVKRSPLTDDIEATDPDVASRALGRERSFGSKSNTGRLLLFDRVGVTEYERSQPLDDADKLRALANDGVSRRRDGGGYDAFGKRCRRCDA